MFPSLTWMALLQLSLLFGVVAVALGAGLKAIRVREVALLPSLTWAVVLQMSLLTVALGILVGAGLKVIP